MRRSVVASLAALALTWTVSLGVHPWSDESVSSLEVGSGYAALILDGQLPYSDFGFEYPPLAGPAIALPGLAGTGEADYRLGIAAFTFLLAVALVLLLATLARRTGGAALPAMLAVAAAPLLLGAVVRLQFDLAPVVLTLAALLALLSRRPALGMALVGVGAMTKGFPLVVAPVALAWMWGGGDRRALARGTAALVATLVVIGGAWVAYSRDGAHDTLEYHFDRALQIESSPATAVWALGAVGGDEPSVVDTRGSAGLEHPLAPAVGAAFASALIMTIALLSALAGYAASGARGTRAGVARRDRAPRPSRRDDPEDRSPPDPGASRALVLAALAAVAAVAAFGQVLLPQFLVWVVPLMALALAWRLWALAATAAAACVLTLAESPSRYADLVDGDQLAEVIVALRNAALVASVAIAAITLLRAGRRQRAPATRVTEAFSPAQSRA